MSELLNIKLFFDTGTIFRFSHVDVNDTIPASIGWSGRVGDSSIIDVNSGEEKQFVSRRWNLGDIDELPNGDLLSFVFNPSVGRWKIGNLMFCKREGRIEMGVSIDLESVLKTPIDLIEFWLVEQLKFLIPMGAFALLVGPEIYLDWEASSSQLIHKSLNSYSNLWWAIIPSHHSAFDPSRFQILSSPPMGYTFLRERQVSLLFK